MFDFSNGIIYPVYLDREYFFNVGTYSFKLCKSRGAVKKSADAVPQPDKGKVFLSVVTEFSYIWIIKDQAVFSDENGCCLFKLKICPLLTPKLQDPDQIRATPNQHMGQSYQRVTIQEFKVWYWSKRINIIYPQLWTTMVCAPVAMGNKSNHLNFRSVLI